jgi:uncharacterized hydrophobic protein (TIGR00271 family)
MKHLIISIRIFLRDIFNLSHETADNLETIRAIEKGVEFRGVNVWTLIFAIFVASIGLNVNSTAVIIGAMLISPLMGPIMGLGLSIAIYDFSLLKKSLKNLTIAVIISVLTSAVYFFISPLSEAQSELLARTTPTIYDVLIALFGGLAGIVAGSTREKGNAIPGVAIATALMPPLCTAGFGLASGNLLYFIGAFYLFFINAVMISLSTFMIVRFLKFPLKQQPDKVQSDRVRRYIYIIVIITVLPSIYLASNIIRQTVFNKNALEFISNEFNFTKTHIINTSYEYRRRDSSIISVTLAGKRLDNETISTLKSKLPAYSMNRTKLALRQESDIPALDMNQIKNGIIEDLYKRNEQALKTKDEQIAYLIKEIESLKAVQFPVKELATEANAINRKVYSLSINRIVSYNTTAMAFDTMFLANLKTTSSLNKSEIRTLEGWMGKRLGKERIRIATER